MNRMNAPENESAWMTISDRQKQRKPISTEVQSCGFRPVSDKDKKARPNRKSSDGPDVA